MEKLSELHAIITKWIQYLLERSAKQRKLDRPIDGTPLQNFYYKNSAFKSW